MTVYITAYHCTIYYTQQADDEARKLERRKCDERERLARIRRENADHKLVLEQRAREVRTSNS
jgi:hypothetical protein